MFKKFSMYICWKKYIKWGVWRVAVCPSHISNARFLNVKCTALVEHQFRNGRGEPPKILFVIELFIIVFYWQHSQTPVLCQRKMKMFENGAWVKWYWLWQADVPIKKPVPALFRQPQCHMDCLRLTLGSQLWDVGICSPESRNGPILRFIKNL
jgi:hypothetical protein